MRCGDRFRPAGGGRRPRDSSRRTTYRRKATTRIARRCRAGGRRRIPPPPPGAGSRRDRPSPVHSSPMLSAGEVPVVPPGPAVAEAGGSHSVTSGGWRYCHSRALRARRRWSPASRPRAAGLDKQKGEEKERRYPLADPPVHDRIPCATIHPAASRIPGRKTSGRSRPFPRGFLLVSVSRSDQDRRGPEANPHPNVAHFITDHERGARIRHPEPPEDLLGQSRPRLSASARAPIRFHRPFRVVRAIFDRVEHDPHPPERGDEPSVDGFHLRPGEFPLCEPGLVGDYREEESLPGKKAQRFRGAGKMRTADGSRRYPTSSMSVPSRSRKTIPTL